MRMIVRRDPVSREMAAWRNTMNQLFSEVSEENAWNRSNAWKLALDVAETEDAFLVSASLPGIKADDLEITLTDNVLTIKGEMVEVDEKEGTHWHLRERRYGNFQRSITLPTPVDADNIEAVYTDGVLNLNIPKIEEVKPKRIQVQLN